MCETPMNIFVTNKTKYFTKLIQKKIGVELGSGANSHVDGIRIVGVSSTYYTSQLIALYPTCLLRETQSIQP